MASLYLIRHGQASFGSENYDALSPLGEKQCLLLGQWWRARSTAFDRAVTGPMHRHKQSFQAFCTGMDREMGAVEIPELAEFDHENVLEVYRPDFADKAVMMRTLAAAPNPRRAFQDMFTEAVSRWHDPRHAADYKEPWAVFKARVLRGFEILRETNGDTLVFTSGGVISVILQAVLDVDEAHCFALNAVTVNSSVSRVLYRSGEASLAGFNNIAHLEVENASNLITYA